MSLFLLNLPQVIAIEVLCEWCQLKDVMKVDSAFCNKTERPELLKMFQAWEFTTAHEVNSGCALNYLIMRGIKVLFIGNKLKESCLNRITSEMLSKGQIFSKLQSLSIPATAEWYKFANMCMSQVSLTSLTITHRMLTFDKTLISLLVPMNLSHLRHIEVSGSIVVSSTLVSHLAQHCHTLEFVCFNFARAIPTIQLDKNNLCQLVCNNCALRKLTIEGYLGVTHAVAQLVAQHCVNLVLLSLQFTDNSPNFLSLVIPIVSSCSRLNQLNLYSLDEETYFSVHYQYVRSCGISSEDLIQLFTCVKNCTSIELTATPNIHTDVLNTITDNSPSLSCLYIANSLITTSGLIEMWKRNDCAELHEISILSCPHVDVTKLKEYLSSRAETKSVIVHEL